MGGTRKREAGLIVVLTGPGKGKTTSAVGTALRACGHGMRVCIIQFIKGEQVSGEVKAIQKLVPAIEVYCGGKGFVGIKGDRHDHETHRAGAQEALETALKRMTSSQYDVMILDEIHNAVALGLVDLSQVLDLLKRKPRRLHLLLTGRDARPEVIARADLVTEMKEIRHPFREGGGPYKGIDY